MSGHTPGTWTNRLHSTFVSSEHGNICVCGDPHASGYVGYTKAEIGSSALDEAVANARLIAAAPDMLAALRPLAAWADELTAKPKLEDCERARAAIAKAEGRAP